MKKVIDFNRLPKQEYITPEIQTIEIEIHGMLAASPPGWGGEGGSRIFEDDYWDE